MVDEFVASQRISFHITFNVSTNQSTVEAGLGVSKTRLSKRACNLSVAAGTSPFRVVSWRALYLNGVDPVSQTYRPRWKEESALGKTKQRYPVAFKQQIVELAMTGRTSSELARGFDISARSITAWMVPGAASDSAKPLPGKGVLTTAKREELGLLRLEVRQITVARSRSAIARARPRLLLHTRSGVQVDSPWPGSLQAAQ